MISNLQHNVLPDLQQQIGGQVKLTLGGVAPEDRDFVHAVYGNFPYVLGFVVLLTFLLLMRAFRSIVLAVKAVILNLISLGCALGVVVFIFQQGHGSEAIWGIQADPGGDRVDPADDLRVPLRPLDGLRGLHRHAYPRGLRRHEGHHRRRSRSGSREPASW